MKANNLKLLNLIIQSNKIYIFRIYLNNKNRMKVCYLIKFFNIYKTILINSKFVMFPKLILINIFGVLFIKKNYF